MKTKLLFLLLAVTSISYGQFWTEYNSNSAPQSSGVNKFSIADANTIWATTYDGSATPTNRQEFTKSIDGGLTWTVGNIDIGDASLGIGDIDALDSNTAWVTGYPNGATLGGIWKTSDGGTTWTKQAQARYNDPASFANIVHFFNANDGFCQGDPIGGYFEIYTTTNGGTNWTRVPSANIPAPLSGEWGYTRGIVTLGDELWFTTNKGRIYHSSDKGNSFTASQSPVADFNYTNNNGGDFSFFDANNGLFVDSLTKIYSTTDAGATWNLESPNGVVKSGDIACVPGTQMAVTVSNDASLGGTSYTLDGGVNWIEEDTMPKVGIDAAHGLIFSGGFTDTTTLGGIYKYTGTLGVNDNEVTIFNAYPNPVTDVLNIEAINAISKVTVFNLLGQNVFEVAPNATTSKLNLAGLTSGSYTIKVTVKDAVQTMKFIKQ